MADPDAHPDEVVLTEAPMASHHFNNARNGNTTNGATSNQNRPPVNRQQQQMAAPVRAPIPSHNNTNPPPQPQTPGSGLTRSTSLGGPPRPNPEAAQSRPPNPQLNPTGRRVLNQPSRNGPPSAPVSPVKPGQSSAGDGDVPSLPPQGAGFFSARAAQMLPESKATEGAPAPIPSHLPAFNPHAESPSIRKTPGIDHKSSKPLTRDGKHVPSSQAVAAVGPVPRPNVINPQFDAARRIGAPGSPSPMANRGQYKPPTKRPIDNTGAGAIGRAPLSDLPANGHIGGDGGDLKRQRMNG